MECFTAGVEGARQERLGGGGGVAAEARLRGGAAEHEAGQAEGLDLAFDGVEMLAV